MPKAPQPLEIARGSANDDPASDHARTLLEATGSTPSRGLQPGGDAALNPLTSCAAEAWAASGAMGLAGEPNEPPRFAAAPLAIAALGAGRALEALRDGRASPTDWPALLAERAALVGHTRQGSVSAGGAARLLKTCDGWIAVQLPRLDDWQLVPAWLEIDLPAERFELDSGWRLIEGRLRTRNTKDVIDRGRLIGLAVAEATRTISSHVPAYQLRATSEAAPIERRLRVLDLTSLWAGPLATSLLADAGCNVLKVEAPGRPDGARSGPTEFFDLMNHGKQSVALDLHQATDRAHFERLLDAADVVVESARPRSLAQLGYDAKTWCSVRAGRLWTSITGYGREQEWIAFGDDAAVAAGLAWPLAPDATSASTPSFCGDAIADPLTGLHAAALMLGFLRNGRGGLLELSLRDVVASTASIEGGSLVASLEGDEQQGWIVRSEGDRVVPVAPPRSRKLRGPAPRLTEPRESALTEWCEDRSSLPSSDTRC